MTQEPATPALQKSVNGNPSLASGHAHIMESSVPALPSRSWAEIDLSAWRDNFRAVAAAVAPAGVAPVIKANAYGLGARAAGQEFCRAGARFLVVSCIHEALELVDNHTAVLLLGGPLPEEIPCILEAGVSVSVPDLETARLISATARELGCRARVHLKIDTGMGRLGLPLAQARDIIRRIAALPALELEGIYSHFPAALRHDALTLGQVRGLAALIGELEDDGIRFRFRHIANSTATAGLPQATRPPFNMVRCGIDLHGAHLSITPRPYRTRPVLNLKARLLAVRRLPPGTTVSYGRTYRVEHPQGERIGVVTIGYADGYPRCLSNRGQMLVQGDRCRVVGRVCMDYTMVSLENVPAARVGDTVVIIGRQGNETIPLAEVARTAETIPYEIICGLGTRVKRFYTDGHDNSTTGV